MNGSIIVDAGPLVALLVEKDEHRKWATEQFGQLRPPLLTCDAVLAEANHIIERHGGDSAKVLDLVTRGVLRMAFHVEDDAEALASLIRRYRNVPMSLADACLVRMSELHPRATVFTTDSDFHIYRRHGRQMIPLLMPADS